MAAAAKEKPAKAGQADVEDVKKAKTVDELEKEALGPKKQKADHPEEPKVKRKPGMLEAVLLTSLVWLAVFGAYILLVLFDPTGDKVIRGATLLLLNKETETREQFWAQDILFMQDWERELDAREQELNAFEDELDLREDMLDDREDELEDRELEVEDWLEIMRDNTAGEGEVTADVTKIARTIELIDAQKAARALEEMDFDIALRICSLIKQNKLAPIFDAMDPEVLVDFIEEMAYVPDPDEWDW